MNNSLIFTINTLFITTLLTNNWSYRLLDNDKTRCGLRQIEYLELVARAAEPIDP